MAKKAATDKRLKQRQACEAFKISKFCYRYQPKLSDENALIADYLKELTARRRTWGFGLCFLYLRMDFIHDQLHDGRSIRLLNVLDDFKREGLAVEVDLSLPSERVIGVLEQIIEWRGKPKSIRCDNGPEYISHKLQKWVFKSGIKLDYIQPGNPSQNAYIEG